MTELVNETSKNNEKYTRWFKYDRDKLWLVYTKIVPVIFEPPFMNVNARVEKQKYLNRITSFRKLLKNLFPQFSNYTLQWNIHAYHKCVSKKKEHFKAH
jgi:hypothetical protein